ncbi:MAG: hypothetical protein HYZ49_10420 [Chloroflexi bacterium]|nr:hypothetical protein [Chloroflexota bacterium]
MTEIEIPVPLSAKPTLAPRTVERACTTLDLTLTLKGTLAKYPGCIHWHYKKGKERATLEITWWPRERRLWLKVARNRRSDWIEDAIPRLKRYLESKL